MTRRVRESELEAMRARAIAAENDRDAWKFQAEAESIVGESYRNERDQALSDAKLLHDALDQATECNWQERAGWDGPTHDTIDLCASAALAYSQLIRSDENGSALY